MNLEKEMTEAIINNPERYKADFKKIREQVGNSKAIYKGEPIPYLYVPKLYAQEDIQSFESAVNGIFDISNRAIELYLTEEKVRSLFGFDKKLEALIRLPHFYDINVPMGRFDIFYYGKGQYKFCELNTDGSSAMNEQKELSQILINSQIIRDFQGKYDFETFELFNSWVNSVGDLYNQFQRNRGEFLKTKSDTVVAIVDFIDKSTSIEFEVFAEAFRAEGYDCFIVDPREIAISDGRMYAKGRAIDVVYRRLVTKDLMDRYSEIPEFIEGIFAGNTCVIGSIKTQIIHTKRFFEVLHHPDFKKFLTKGQIDFIDSHIPHTKPLDAENPDAYLRNKNNYIIKPVDYYASKGVYAGSDYSEKEWQKLLKERQKDDFIIQSYCNVAPIDNILLTEKGLFERNIFGTITGLYVYNEKLAGLYVRGGLNAIISGLHSGYTFATFIAKTKNEQMTIT